MRENYRTNTCGTAAIGRAGTCGTSFPGCTPGWPVAALVAALLPIAGCAPRQGDLLAAFPQAGQAAPWRLESPVWAGDFADAAAALGDDAANWGQFAPQRVWLAAYHDPARPGSRLTVRIFRFADPAAARRAFEFFRPPNAAAFHAGDAGCWTEIGVLFAWGRLVLDIFGPDAALQNEVAAARLAGILERRMPPGCPDRGG